MTRNEHNTIVNQLLSMVGEEHQATASELLTQLSDDYDTTLTESENNASEVMALRERNEKLRAVNTELFLKTGTTKKTEGEPEKKEENETENKPSFDDLFNEKGELK